VGAGRAQQMGYKNVFIMPMGITGWEKDKKPVEHG
jgi:rhodanese-related sulfurtransferase